jgi:proton-translocating NADH-quinone oxidoreductase chain M
MKLLLILPIIGSFIIAVLPKETVENKERIKQVALLTSILTLLEGIKIWIGIEEGVSNFQRVWRIDWLEGITLGIDGISIIYILLTVIIIPICILASWSSIKILEKQYYISLLVLESILIAVFTVLDLLGFYICFEAVLIPMFIIIGVWGGREEKITASYYFFFYTLIGSVLFLISIIYIYKLVGSTDYNTILGSYIQPDLQNWIFLAFFASLAVKIPKFPFHVWLPLAHVEAPLGGSIILAAILIKLGSYGLIRFALPILPDACIYFTPLVYTLSVLGIIYASLTTIRQTDLKRIIAYSSVSHMAVVTLSIFTLTAIGIEGSIFLQVAHGIVSSALFIIVTILYDRHHTRIVKYYRGVTLTMPLFSALFFYFTLANIAVPLSCNFVGEFLSLLATFEHNPLIAILASSGIILSACYSLFLYNRVAFGTMSPYITNAPNNRDVSRREFFLLLPLVFFTIILGVFPNLIFSPIHASVLNILSYIHPV